jgi:hypothetical protein
MKDIQSLDEFQASRKTLNEGAAEVKANQKKITDILVDAGYVDGGEFWFVGSKTIQCDGKQNATMVWKTLDADGIKCHVDKNDVDVVLESTIEALVVFLQENLKGEDCALTGSCVTIQESTAQPIDIRAVVDRFNADHGTRYRVKPGEGREGDPKYVVEAETRAEAIEETVIMRASKPKFDVTSSAKSIAARLEASGLIKRMDTMSLEGIKDEFGAILQDKDGTHASDATRRKWMDILAQARNKVSLMFSITNLYLGGANMKVDPKSY